MKIIPAINLKNGFCVRQVTGQYHNAEVIKKSVVEIAKDFQAQGAEMLRVVDLDGAMVGHSCNEDVIQKILDAVDIPVEAGGGLRSISAIDMILNMGVKRVIIGTKAVQSPAFIRDAVSCFGADRIVLAVDARNGMVVMEGWEKISSYNAVTFSMGMREMGITTISYTDILRNGMHKGPNIEHTAEVVRKTGLDIIANGGIFSMKDLEQLHEIGVKGAIVDSAMYDGKIDLIKAKELFA